MEAKIVLNRFHKRKEIYLQEIYYGERQTWKLANYILLEEESEIKSQRQKDSSREQLGKLARVKYLCFHIKVYRLFNSAMKACFLSFSLVRGHQSCQRREPESQRSANNSSQRRQLSD